MDPTLRDMLSDNRSMVRDWFSALGIQTCSDVRFMWEPAVQTKGRNGLEGLAKVFC